MNGPDTRLGAQEHNMDKDTTYKTGSTPNEYAHMHSMRGKYTSRVLFSCLSKSWRNSGSVPFMA